MFIVVKAILDFDYLPKDGITYVAKFDSRELAEAYVTSVEENYGKWCKETNDKLDAFVNQFELPSTLTLDKWKRIVEDLYPFLDEGRPPYDTQALRGHIKRYLWDGRQLKNFGIQIGQRAESHFDLYIVEVKD